MASRFTLKIKETYENIWKEDSEEYILKECEYLYDNES